MRTAILLLALAGGTALASTPPPTISEPKLRPTFGGAFLETTITGPADRLMALMQVWTPRARLKLYDCQPSCREVQEIPINGAVTFSETSRYRIILGGRQAMGRKHGLYFSFEPDRVLRIAEVAVAP